MSSEAATPSVDVTPLAAPGFLGCIFNVFLFGVLTVQAYLYYLSFPKDKFSLKCLVWALYTTELVQTLLILYDGFRIYARHFTDVSAIDDVGITWLNTPIMCGIVGCVVQIFFVYRIWVLSRQRLVCGFIIMVSLLQCAAGIATGVLSLEAKLFTRITIIARVPYTLWQIAAAVSDVMIAVTMTICLYRKRSLFKETNTVITRLISVTLETGTATATIAILEIVLFFAYPSQIYFTVLGYSIAKVYSNSFMAVLNNRMRISGGRNDRQGPITTSTFPTGNLGSSDPHVIHVKTDTWSDVEGVEMENTRPNISPGDARMKIGHSAPYASAHKCEV